MATRHPGRWFSLLLLAAAACLVRPDVSHAQRAQLVVGLTSDVPTLDGSMDLSPIGFDVRLNLYDQLTEMRRDGSGCFASLPAFMGGLVDEFCGR